MITKMPVLVAPTHSTRPWAEAVVTYTPAQKPRPPVVTLGGIDLDSNTGMFAAECRHT